MAREGLILSGFLVLGFIAVVSGSVSSKSFNPSAAPKAINDLREAIVKGLGFKLEEGLKVSGFDVHDALVGQSIAYEFDIQVGKKTFPVKLLEDVSRWEIADLPIFRADDAVESETALVERGRNTEGRVLPVLPPFQLAGPMELWIQDGDDMRLSLPHDVEAGALKKVLLSDGAVVIVKGAKSVSLRNPLDLPLPLNSTSHKDRPFASGLLAIAEALRSAARSTEKPLLSLRIVGPTSLTSIPSASPNDRLKLKRLAPGLVELSSISASAVTKYEEGSLAGNLWPLTSLNGSNANLRAFEELLASVLGKAGKKRGSFRLINAEVSARTYMKMGFSVEKRLLDGQVDWSGFAEWKTKPEKTVAHFEVIARLEDDGKVIPERIAEVQPVELHDSVLPSVQTGNVTMNEIPVIHPPPLYFTL